MIRVYPAIFHEEDEGYWVEFPDLIGCQSSGETIEDAAEMAQEALGLYLASLMEDGTELPKPTDIKDLDQEKVMQAMSALMSINFAEIRERFAKRFPFRSG